MQSILRTIGIVLPVALTGAPAMAQPAYPSKPVRFLVGAPAGGSNDIFARAISQRLSEALGQPVIVDNRPGASQMIAADLTAKAPADGHTLYITSTTYTAGVALMAKQPFDPVNDLPVSRWSRADRWCWWCTRRAGENGQGIDRGRARAAGSAQLHVLRRRRHQSLRDGSAEVDGQHRHRAHAAQRHGAGDHRPDGGQGAGADREPAFGETPDAIGTARARSASAAPSARSSCRTCRRSPKGLPGYESNVVVGRVRASKTPKPIIDRLNTEIHKAMASRRK